jgi:gamma-glutamyltranspeptidase / glutathione hydrolase
MVASTHWLASAAGMAVLEQGGNAFDAAVAAGFTLQVVEPHLNGPGGDLPALLWPAGGEPVVLAAQGPAPRAATIARYRHDFELELVPGTGPLAAVVPGSFGGWLAMLRDHGTLPLRDVLRFAIGYAEDGYPVLPRIAGAIRNVEQLFRDDWLTSADVYLPVPEPGSLHRNPRLAATYRRILDESNGSIDAAHDCWYRGFVADAILRFQEQEWLDSSGERHAGLLAEEDLRDWRPAYEQPLAVDYQGLTVLKAGPWSQAPVFLQQLRLLEGFDLAELGHASAEYVHTVTECAKLAFADREAWYGDPHFVDVPVDELLSRAYADERRKLVGEEASAELRPGAPEGRLPVLATPSGGVPIAPGVGEPTRSRLEAPTAEPSAPGHRPGNASGVPRGDTVHVDVVDRWGNMVAATPSGGWLWGAPVIPELGFCLGTRAQMFWLEEGLPNSLEPGKRPRTTLSPTLVARGGDPYLALGTPGGDLQDQWSLNTFLAHVHFGLDLQAAIDAPGHHTEAFPSSFYPRKTRVRHVAVEERAGEATVDGLRARGHDVEVSAAWSLGRVSAVGREADGQLKAGANPRGMQGYAVGR